MCVNCKANNCNKLLPSINALHCLKYACFLVIKPYCIYFTSANFD